MARVYCRYTFLDNINNFSDDRASHSQVKIMLESKKKINKKKILVYGYGISGKACFYYLKKKNNVSIYDDNKKNIPVKLKK